MASNLADERQLVEPRDLPLALDPGGIVRVETADQCANPLAELEREMGGRCPHQLADVVDGDPAAVAQAGWMLSLTHFCGTASSRVSISAWTETEIALGSPITHPWL